ncbi:MAG: 30S ribosomal protein S6 [Nitrospirota bacterium]
MNFYENIVILDPNLDEKATEEAVERVKNIIIKKGGDVLRSENWGSRKLAYDIKKHKKGTYVLIFFKAPPSSIAELEKFYKVFDLALKFMIIKLGKKEIDKIMSAQPAGQAGPTLRAEPAPLDSDLSESGVDSTLREKEDKGV